VSIGNSPEEDRPSVGQALQQARIDAGLTVEEVSSSTRVRVPIVHAIEQDDFSRCGGYVYARGHIRTFAKAVGTDPAGLVEQFDAEQGASPAPTPAAPLFEAERIRPEPRSPNWTAAMVAAIVAVIAFVGFTFLNDDGGGAGGGKPAAEGDLNAPSPKRDPGGSEPSAPEPGPPESAIAAAPADKVTVKLTAVGGSSWISAEDHTGRLMHEGVLKDGDSKTFTDSEQVDLVLGNAGAVDAHVNGKPVGKLGEVGQVQRVSYTKGDPEQG
jgi:cytoskeleton protein RodZ